jgi:hypothetical protein
VTVLVTDDGQVIGGHAPGMAALPVVRASLGDLGEAQVQAAGAVLASLDPVVVVRVDEVVVGRDDTVTLTLAGGIPVRMGGPGEEGAKAAALRAVLRWAAGEGVSIEEIDVSVPGAPAATLEDGQTLTP